MSVVGEETHNSCFTIDSTVARFFALCKCPSICVGRLRLLSRAGTINREHLFREEVTSELIGNTNFPAKKSSSHDQRMKRDATLVARADQFNYAVATICTCGEQEGKFCQQIAAQIASTRSPGSSKWPYFETRWKRGIYLFFFFFL